MNQEQAVKLLPLITALAEGKLIQGRATTNSNWTDTRDPLWHPSQQYRVKPEVVVKYINIYEDGSRYTHVTLSDAIKGKTRGDGSPAPSVRTIKVIEEEV